MIIAIDAGNSAVKVALVDAAGVWSVQRLPTRDAGARARLDETLRSLSAHAPGGEVDTVALVSVVPSWTEAVREAVGELGTRLLVADHASIPITAQVAHPEGVGADRLLDAYSAARLHGTPVIVVDLGTATTVDAVDASGAFVGGAILAGVELGVRALATGTEQLPQVQVSQLPRALGRDTQSAISSGMVFGQVGAVRELVERIANELSPAGAARPTVVLTGGTSRAAWASVWLEPFGDQPPIADVLEPDLTLRGLGLLHAELAELPA